MESNQAPTDYEEDDIYVNSNLYQMSHLANGIYEYNITDHNKDLRVSFRDSSDISVPLQSISYDLWGLTMKGMQVTRNPVNFNKFTFQGKVFSSKTGAYNFGTRMYDPTIGRWGVIDLIMV